MVAQSYETAVAVTSLGRTSPFAASTAEEYQPMDLVKRKSGQSSHQPENGYGFVIPGFVSQQANSPVVQVVEPHQFLCEIDQIHPSTEMESVVSDSIQVQVEKGTSVLADCQRPEQLCQQGAFQHFKEGNSLSTDNGLQHEQNQLQGIMSEFFPPEVDHTKQASLPKGKSEIHKQAEQPVRAKQRKHEMLSRWQQENSQVAQQLCEAGDQFQQVKTNRNQNQDALITNLQDQKTSLQSKMHCVMLPQLLCTEENVINNENAECQDKQIDSQQIQWYRRNSSQEKQTCLEEKDLVKPQVQDPTSQGVKLDLLVPQQQNACQESEIRCELAMKDKKSDSEGASLLLLLADGKRHTTEGLLKLTDEAISEVQVTDKSEQQEPSASRDEAISEVQVTDESEQQEPSASQCMRADSVSHCMREREQRDSSDFQRMGADEMVTKVGYQTLKVVENQDADLSHVDDERDGTLIIVDGDPQVVDVENGVQNCKTSSTYAESYDNKVSNVIQVTYQDPGVVTLDKEKQNSLDKEKQNSLPKSRSRIESQRKMEEGKQWLLNSLMLITSSLSVIKLSDIESSYLAYCQKNNKESLATPVLARLIHSLFPEADKCRLGARGNQRIHYRSLKFRTEESNTKQQSRELCKDTGNEIKANKPKSQLDTQMSQQSLDEKEISDQKPRVDQPKACDSILSGTDLSDEDSQAQCQSGQNYTSLAADDEENCKAASKKLSEVLKWITCQGEEYRKALLRDFAHSASCQKPTCVPVCLMFRRVRRHVVAAQHSCSVLRLYSMLLRHHVSSCSQAKCGLPACPALRATRPTKRTLEIQQHSAKRAAVYPAPGMYRPSSIILAPRSPGGSLPGSPVNSPPASPSASPGRSILSLAPGQVPVQVIMVPVMVENHGA